MKNFVIFLVLFGLASHGRALDPLMPFPKDLETLPVLIQIPSPTNSAFNLYGSGAYLSESNRIFLVTAAHVLFDSNSNLVGNLIILSNFDRGQSSTNRNAIFLSLKHLMDEGLIKRHMTHDVAVIQVGRFDSGNTKIGMGATLAGKIGEFVTWDTSLSCQKMQDIPAGAEIYVFGYPVELFNDRLPPEIDFSTPLIRRGIVSQINLSTGKLIVDSGVYGGNSGGPVVVANHAVGYWGADYKIIGIVTQFVPYQTRVASQLEVTNSVLVNAGYAVVEPIDYALELIHQF